MKLSIYIVSFCIFGWAQADDGWGSIMSANDWEGLKTAELQVNQEQRWQKACELEKKRSLFPKNCLEILQLWFQEPYLASLKMEVVQISKLCVLRSESIDSFSYVQKALSHQVLPALCRSALDKRKKDLTYSLGLSDSS